MSPPNLPGWDRVPVGYGKAGSFEGFCSGGGIRKLAVDYVKRELEQGSRDGYVNWDCGCMMAVLD